MKVSLRQISPSAGSSKDLEQHANATADAVARFVTRFAAIALTPYNLVERPAPVCHLVAACFKF